MRVNSWNFKPKPRDAKTAELDATAPLTATHIY